MAHQPDSTVIETVVQLLCESGLSQMAEAVRIMLNEAMRIERSQVLGPLRTQRAAAGLCQRLQAEDDRDPLGSDDRAGAAGPGR